jgi:hypothetical protein
MSPPLSVNVGSAILYAGLSLKPCGLRKDRLFNLCKPRLRQGRRGFLSEDDGGGLLQGIL